MRAWIANKLFDLARWVDFETVQGRCEMASIARDIVKAVMAKEPEPEKPKRKRVHRKSSVAGARRLAGARLKVSKVAEPKPRGRPKGSKNKPKGI